MNPNGVGAKILTILSWILMVSMFVVSGIIILMLLFLLVLFLAGLFLSVIGTL